MDDNKDPQTPALDYDKDIHTPSLEDIFNEEAETEDALEIGDNPADKENITTEEPKATDEKPVETPKEEEKPPAPPIDEDKLTDKIVENLVDKLAPQQTTTEEKKDWKEQLKELQKQASDDGREFTYDEALTFLKDVTKEQVKEELKDEVKQEVLKDLAKEVEDEEVKAKQEQEAQQQAEETRKTELNGEWDRQLQTLEANGKIEKVINQTDPNDRGVKQRVALFEALQKQTEEQKNANQPISFNLTEAFITHYKDPFEMPPGATAPVNGTKRSITPSNPNEFSYDDVHSQSLEDIMRNG